MGLFLDFLEPVVVNFQIQRIAGRTFVIFPEIGLRQAQFDNPLAIHIRGEDSDGNWVEDPRPEYEMSPESIAAVDEYWDRYRNAMKAQT